MIKFVNYWVVEKWIKWVLKKTKGSQHQSQKNGWQVRHKVSRIKALSPLFSSLAIFSL